MALVERHAELRTLAALYADCARGRGQVALISGSVASGKTELLHAFAERSAVDGAILLTATGSRAERTLRFGVLGQLFHSPAMPETVTDKIISLVADAEIADFTAANPDAIGRSSARILDGVCTAILELAKDRPVVIGVDDVQFADGASLQALLYLQRRMRFARVMVIFTEWALPRPTQAEFRAEVTRQPNTSHLRLAPLSRAGVAELLATRLHDSTAHTLAPVYHALSGGNPLLVHALAEDYRTALRAGGSRVGEIAVGQEFGHGVVACLHRWEPAMLAVARGLALLGGAGGLVPLGKLLDLSADAVAQALEVLETAGLLDGGRFRHPLAKAAVLDSLAPGDRAALHGRAATLLHHGGAPAAEVAAHLIAADQVDGQWAVAVLRHAAEEALVLHRVEQAMQAFELAASGCADDVERADITVALLRVEWRYNPAAAGRHLAPLRQARARGLLSEANTLHLAKFLVWYGHTEELADILGGLVAAGRLGPAFHWLAFLYPAAVADVPVQRAETSTATSWPHVSSMIDCVRLGGGSAAEIGTAAERVLQTSRLGEQTFASQLAAIAALVHADRNDRAVHWCTSLLAEATTRGAATWQAVIGSLRAETLLRQGDLPAASAQARAAHHALSTQGWGVAIGEPLSVRIAAATAMGEHDDAAALLRQPVPDAMFHTQFGLRYLHARGLHHLATDRPHAALDDFRQCGELMIGWNLDLPTLVPWRVSAAQAHLALGDTVAARALAAEQLAHPGGSGARTRGTALRVLAAASTVDRRVPLLLKAVDLLHVGGDRFELARALRKLGQAHDAAGDYEKGRSAARRSLQIAKACHAEPISLELVPSQDTGPVDQAEPRAGMDTLSEAERRVAVLAARGHTNREIGGKLYITVSTVEQHLTRVYRKLNVTRRTDLSAGLPQQLLAAAEER
ncbi:helix-turn-helix transcriptional regulator [Actinokineospora sp.]|uniref:helix-turn-helix transcriptional regulator n=1 Tax=Actinokineospora sp. TaxID=1872133 RepID=UPI0040383A64